MMPFGKPDILDPKFELRPIQAAMRAAKARIETLEAAVTILQNTRGSSTADMNALLAQIATLTTLVGAAAITELQALLAGDDGIVVKTGTSLTVRTLEAGSNITITYPDGVDGNPVIASSGGGGDSVLYDDTGRAMLTADGQAILVET